MSNLRERGDNFQSEWLSGIDRRLSPLTRIFAWSILFQIILIVYWPAIKAPFLYDDLPCIVTNPDLRHPGELERFFSNHESSMQFDHRPLVGILTMINFQVAGLEVVIYRILNLVIHWAVAVLLGEFVIGLAAHFRLMGGRSFGLATSFFWALHPLNTVTVIFISQRMESLMIFFYLLSLWFLLQAGARGHSKFLWGCALSSVACLASKEVGVSLLASLAMLDRVCHFTEWRELFRNRWKFYLVIGFIWSGFIFWWSKGMRIVELEGMALSDPRLYFQTECRVIVEYVRKVLWPNNLVFVGSPKVPETTIHWLPHALALTTGFLVCARIALKGRRWVWIPAFLFFFVLGPTSSFLPIPQEPEAEWRMYLPSACLVILILAIMASLLKWLEVPPKWMAVSTVALLAVLGVTSWKRAGVYRSSVSLWADNVAKDPFASKAWINLGVAHYNHGNLEGVTQVSQVLWRLGSRFDDSSLRANAMFLASLVAKEQEEYAKAEDLLRKALQEEPDGRYHNDLAHVLLEQHKIEEALVEIKMRLTRYPEDPYALALLGEVLIKMGKNEEGREALMFSEKLFPQSKSLEETRSRIESYLNQNSTD